MNKKQYNNVIKNTLKYEQTEDSLATARAVFKNMGVALPHGDIKEVFETIKSGNYMSWRACSMKEAQAAADQGIAAIGISDKRILVLSANDEEQPITKTTSVMSISENTSALEVDGLKYFSYGRGRCGGGCGTTGCNIDYKGCQILTSNQLLLLNSNKAFYQYAANTYGIPWKMLAAIHYRENGLMRTGPINGNGPYQIWGSSYPVGTLTDTQFQQATNDAANFLAQKAGNRDLNLSDNVKYTFFAYNGISDSYKTQAINLGFTQFQANNGEGSPYVMNRADLIRDPTVEPTKSNQTWGQVIIDGGPIQYPANQDYGAYVVFNAI